MVFDVTYAYSTYILFFSIVWLALFCYRSDLRKEIIVMSLLSAPLGPLGDFFYKHDYYHLPVLNGDSWILQSFLVGFFLGGISAVLYASLLNKKRTRKREAWRNPAHRWWFCGVLLSGIGVMILGTFILSLNSIYVSLLVMVAGGIWIVWHRRDLLSEAVGNGILLAALLCIFYVGLQFLFPRIFLTQWNLADLSGVFFLGIPLEELLFAFAWGFITGPAYEFVYCLRYTKSKA